MVEGWEEVKLGDIAEIRMCKRIFAGQTTTSGDIPFFKIGTFGKDPDAYISRSLYEEYRSKYPFPNKGDILLSAAGTLGRTVVYNGKPAYFQDSNIVWLEIDEGAICNEYLNHCYQVLVWASPEGSTISRLYNGIIRDTDIKLPSLPEQRLIATALSDADAYITSLEKLLAKKRAVKQGVMQELLTGKRRLPGFSGEWGESELGACFYDIIGGGTPSRSNPLNWGNEIPWVTVKDYATFNSKSTQEYITRKGLENSSSHLVPRGTPITSTRMGLGQIVVYEVDVAINQDLKALFIAEHIDKWFIVYWFRFSQKRFENLGTGSTVKGISLNQLKEQDILLPPTLAEQTAIAAVLSDMDAEIDALTAKLNKAKRIKQGMMSELLTGRIRLIQEVKPQ
jgi:type I restriction enzyme S subunit